MKERGALCIKHLLDIIGSAEQLSHEVYKSTQLWQKLIHEGDIPQCLSWLSLIRVSLDLIMKRYAVDSTEDSI